MNSQNRLLAVIGILLIGLTVFGGLLLWRNTSAPQNTNSNIIPANNQPQEPTPTVTAPIFTQEGNIVRNNPGMDPGIWYLVYDAPGQPGLSKKLQFAATTKYVAGNTERPLVATDIAPGARVRIEGTEQNGVIMVSRYALITQQSAETMNIRLYYYNQSRDQTGGCDIDAVLPVNRTIPKTQTPIEDSINLLLQGEITAAERAAGFRTEFPNANFRLKSAQLQNGVVALEFTEVAGFSSGGSCRVRLLANQVAKTAQQFPGVNQVVFKPESIFQP